MFSDELQKVKPTNIYCLTHNHLFLDFKFTNYFFSIYNKVRHKKWFLDFENKFELKLTN